jgi:hypothetical protein
MRIGLAALLLLACSLPLRPEQVPVLTVCEALRQLQQYRGRGIIVVGLYGWTMEGGFLSENCVRSSDRTKRSTEELIALRFSPQAPPLPTGFVWNRAALEARLRQAQIPKRTKIEQHQNTGQALLPSEKRVAVYGRLQSPKVFHGPIRTRAGIHSGNGYGANGSVKAALLDEERAEYDFDGPDAGAQR